MDNQKLDFLRELLINTLQSGGEPKVIYPLLQANLDKLDENLPQLIRLWAKSFLTQGEPKDAPIIAEAILQFSTIIGTLPYGNISNNLEILIAACEVNEIILTRDASPIEWAKSKLNLGWAYCRRIYGDPVENLEKAFLANQDALTFFTCEEYGQEWAEIHNNLLACYLKKIRMSTRKIEQCSILELIEINCNKALDIFWSKKLLNKWTTLKNNLASLSCDIANQNCSESWESAINTYKEILEVINKDSLPKEWANTQMHLGIAYNKRLEGKRPENLDLAIAALNQALQVYTREDYPFIYAINQNNLGNAYRDKGLTDLAIASYRLALEIHQPKIYPDDAIIAARNLGNLAFKTELWKEAIEGYSLAIEAVETRRIRFKTESQRQEVLQTYIDVYQNMVQACINAGEIATAFEYAERSHSKLLVDLMASNHLYPGEEIPSAIAELLQQYDALQRQIDQERDRHKSNNNRSETRAAWVAYNNAIASLEAEKQQVWQNLRRLDPVLAGEIQVSPPNLSAIQKLIDNSTTAIVSFYTTKNDTHIFVLRQNQISLHHCTGQGIETLQNWISQNWLSPYMRDRQTWDNKINNILSELAQHLQLTQLISQHLQGIEELILVPHLLLHQIPFAALPIADNQDLGKKFLIRYTPSCQILEFCQQRENLETLQEISLQYGTVEDAEDNLPCANFEGENIAQLYSIPQEKRLIGSRQATCNNYRQLAQQVQVLHSCHHAQSRLDNSLESQLKLADGCITLGQLMTPSWRLPNLLDVFLSCCETNLGMPSLTDDILTLSTGFLCAGARSVVSTLWSVNDLATALFSIFYYQHRQENKTRPRALQLAQIKLSKFRKEDLTEIYNQARKGRMEARRKRQKYKEGSVEYLECDREYRKYAGLTIEIDKIKNSTEEFPFSHPRYWAAFIGQGLR